MTAICTGTGSAPVMLPVLSRRLIDKVEVATRTCCLIVDTMCKIVEDLPAMTQIMSKLKASVRERDLRVPDSSLYLYGQQCSRAFLAFCRESCTDDHHLSRMRGVICLTPVWLTYLFIQCSPVVSMCRWRLSRELVV